MGIWVRDDIDSKNRAGFAGLRTNDYCANMLGSHKCKVES